ncbi:MAG: endolytic transglycosylase MltG [Holophagales bacterium]|jgi:UPF0755 protein|nr:endolytic transglycosylase MltG [Holophagales bacterium]
MSVIANYIKMLMPEPRTMRRALLALALAFLFLAPVWGLWAFFRSGPSLNETTVLVRNGMTVNQVAQTLYSQGVIRNKTLFKFWGRAARLKLMRGEYLFPPGASMSKVTRMLTRGEIHVTKLVISPAIHGWALQKRLEPFIPADAFWAMWKSPKLTKIAGFPNAPSLEGLIAPATYNLNLAMAPEEIMLEMVETFRAQVLPRLEGGVLPPYETLILASLAEKETNIPEELPRITGVFYNRLKVPMRLQCDPTSLYARWLSGDVRFTSPTRNDIARNHPYNTYSVMGLPPSPIAIPGKAAIEAAKAPMKTEEFYFVATGKGGHNFSRTLNEHNSFVNTYRAEITRQRKGAQKGKPAPSTTTQGQRKSNRKTTTKSVSRPK